MQLSEAGLTLIKNSEGFRDQMYTDIAGFQTIGYGHRLLPGESYPNGITQAFGLQLLDQDVASAEVSVARLVKVALNQGEFDALVDFVFNLGAARLMTSTLLAYLNAGKYDAAAQQLLLWDHSGHVEVEGLKVRREAEYALWQATAA
jgi:lysozyme